MVTGIKKKITSLEIRAVGMYILNRSKCAVERVAHLAKMERKYFFEHKETLLSNHKVKGTIKREFSFDLDRKNDLDFPETYYGLGFATKYVIYATIVVDDSHEGQTKVELQMRNIVPKK